MNNKLSNFDKDIMINSLTDKKMYSSNEIAEIIYEKVCRKEYNTGDIIEINNGLK